VSTAGQVLGRDDAAAKVVADVERRSDAAARTHPEFRGKRGAMAMYYEGYWVYGPTDPRMRLLDALGFTIPPEYAEVTKGKYAVEISPERADMLDVDALVWLNTAADQKRVDADRVYTGMQVNTQGRAIATGGALSKAIGFVSPLSLPYTLDKLVPALSGAVDGDPATPADPSHKRPTAAAALVTRSPGGRLPAPAPRRARARGGPAVCGPRPRGSAPSPPPPGSCPLRATPPARAARAARPRASAPRVPAAAPAAPFPARA
jgi:hypothetical protein